MTSSVTEKLLRHLCFEETDYDKAGSETGSSDTSEIKSYVREYSRNPR